MKKIPRDDPRSNNIASEIDVDMAGLTEHLAGKHRWVIATTRDDGRPQMSLVTGGLTSAGQLTVSTYPQRAKAKNGRENTAVSVLVMGEEFSDAWVQIDGTVQVIDLPDAAEDFVAYYRCIRGEHPDWDEYLQAMSDQGKCMMVITPSRWSPVSSGGFPPELFED